MSGKNAHTPKRKIPAISWLLIALALASMLFGGVAAYLSTSTNAAKHTFTPDTDNTPTVSAYTVDVGNPGYSVYVRAAVVVNWVDSKGEVLAVQPAAKTDYIIEYGTNWFQKDGFWYHKDALSSGTTQPLITSISPATEKTGYTLKADILAQTIQALGTTDADKTPAVTDAWKVSVDTDGKLADS